MHCAASSVLRIQIGQRLIGLLGLETGHYIPFSSEKKVFWDMYGGYIVFLGIGIIAIVQLSFFSNDCEDYPNGVTHELDNGFAGGHKCLNQNRQLSYLMVAGMIMVMVFSVIAPLKLMGWKLIRCISIFPIMTKALRAAGYCEIVAHHNPPDQVFLADGGHFDNTAILPLLRRRCSKIIAVDSEDCREVPPLKHMMNMALTELGITFHMGNSRRPLSTAVRMFAQHKSLSLTTLYYFPENEREIERRYQAVLSGATPSVPFERALQVCSTAKVGVQLSDCEQDFLNPRLLVNLIKLAGARSCNHEKSVFASDSLYRFVLQCQEELKPLLGRLPGATHIAQIPEALDLIYIYFEDEDSKAKAIALLEDVPMNGVIDT